MEILMNASPSLNTIRDMSRRLAVLVPIAFFLVLTGCASNPTSSSKTGEDKDLATSNKADESDENCPSRSILLALKGSKRILCKQGIFQGTVKYENAAYLPASELNDSLTVLHRKLIDPKYYYPHQNISVGEQLKSHFTSVIANEFSDDISVKTSFVSVFKVTNFMNNDLPCFGFTKHTRWSLSTGYICRPDAVDYSPEQVKERLSKLTFW